MDTWVTKDLRQFQEIYLRCSHDEPALSGCAMAMMKMLNGFSEMSHTKFYRYEKKMFGNAMKLFAEQCVQQIYAALECRVVEEKREYIGDLEDSISAMIEVYKNIMEGVSNAERKIFQSLPVDIKIHDLSPKLCAFYSSVLEKVVSMFCGADMEYAFVLHPTLHSTIKAVVLLKKREQSGKVVIIYISERMIEEFDVVSICLLHEAFHILTKDERMRSKRANYFMGQMLEQVKNQIFHHVFLGENGNTVKERLMSKWFGDVEKQMEIFKGRERDDKSFYSEKIKKEVVNSFKEYLGRIDAELPNTVIDAVCEIQRFKDYAEYQKETLNMRGDIEKMKGNIYHMVSENLLMTLADWIMFIYRETYADIACILLLDMTPELYEKAFTRSIQFHYDASYVDDARMLRESIVANVLHSLSTVSPEFRRSWKRLSDRNPFSTNCTDDTDGIKKGHTVCMKNQLQGEEFCDKIEIDTTVRGKFEDYLLKCANSLLIRLQSLKCEGLEEFRALMENVITGSQQQQLLWEILGGDALRGGF